MAKRSSAQSDLQSFKMPPSIAERLRDDLATWGLCLLLVLGVVSTYFFFGGASRQVLQMVEFSEVPTTPSGLPQQGLAP